MDTIAIPWYKSKIIVGAVVSAVAKLLVLTGVLGEIDAGLQSQVVDFVVLGASLLADAYVVRARTRQTQTPVLTATKQQATVLTELTQASVAAATNEIGDLVANVEAPTWMTR